MTDRMSIQELKNQTRTKEQDIHIQVCDYLRMQYPNVLFWQKVQEEIKKYEPQSGDTFPVTYSMTVRVMSVAEGYVMARHTGCTPFVESVEDFQARVKETLLKLAELNGMTEIEKGKFEGKFGTIYYQTRYGFLSYGQLPAWSKYRTQWA